MLRRLALLFTFAALSAPFAVAQTTPTAAGRVLRPNTVIHSVADLDRSLAFYRDAVGLLPDPAPAFPAGSSHEIARLTHAPGATLRAASLRVPGGDVRLTLVQFSGVDARPARPRLQDPGNMKLVVRVRDMDTAFERVRNAVGGVYTEGGAPIRPEGPAAVNRAVIMRDPDGFPLEFAFQGGPIAADVPAASNVIGGWATFIVSDAAATLEFYRDRLGFQPASMPSPLSAVVLSLQGTPAATGSMSAGMRPPGGSATWRLYDFRNIERTRLSGRLQDPGTVAVSFVVDDAAALLARLQAANVAVENGGPVRIDGRAHAFIRDPNGLLVELVEAGAAEQDADDYRGGWRTDSGEAHTYEFSIRGTAVRGIYCTYCADATTLAFVDGTFGKDGVTFEVTHVKPDGSTAYRDKARATFSQGRLTVTGTSGAPGGGKFERVLIKDPSGPDPIPAKVTVLPKDRPSVPGNIARRNPDGADGLPYIQPGPWKKTLTEKDIVGVWLGFGVGSPKQYFIIKKAGDRLRGMVCGTCDNPYTMAALDDVKIDGDLLKFNLLHEDWADGDLPTFYKHFTCHVGWNELRCSTAADHMPPPRPRPDGTLPGFSLTGPIPIEATRGNKWAEWPPKGTSEPR
jgi:catechol 2,3-dioxygenase-like lactoylglutathione lyase family enzyme